METDMFKKLITKLLASTADVDIVDKENRFNVVYQKMLNTRWYITIITLLTLLLVLVGIMAAIVFKVHLIQEWKEMLFLLLGAFIGSYNRVIDFWFNNSQRDEKLIEKMDQEDDSDELLKRKLAVQAQNSKSDPVAASAMIPVETPAISETDSESKIKGKKG